MKIVYVDTIIFDLQHAGGISVYWYEIISRMLKDEDVDPYFIVSSAPKNNIYWDKLSLPQNKVILYDKFLNRYRAVNYKEEREHIFISSYYRYSKNKNARNITLVHDFTYEIYFHGFGKWVHHKQKSKAIAKSEHVICISENTKKDLYRFCKCKCPATVIYNGVSDKYLPLEEREITEGLKLFDDEVSRILESGKFVLYIGARWGYKNWKSAVKLFETAPDDFYMISVGGGKLTEEEIKILGENSYRHIWLDSVSEEKLCVLYNTAYCLLYLSEYEGFGLPVAEAEQCGCPVIALNKSSIPEVAGSNTVLLDGEKFVFEDKLSHVKRNVTVFDWSKTYDEINSVFGSLV